MGEIVIAAVAPEALKNRPGLRAVVGEYMARALEYDVFDELTPAKLLERAERGELLVLVVQGEGESEGVATVEIVDSDAGRSAHVLTLAGVGIEFWLGELDAAVTALAREQQCDAVTMTGRPGWTRQLASHGFRTRQVTMGKKL